MQLLWNLYLLKKESDENKLPSNFNDERYMELGFVEKT